MKRFSAVSVGILAAGLLVMGTAGNAFAHTKKPAVPVVKVVTPDQGSVNGGTTVDIKGANMITASEVIFGTTTITQPNFTFKHNNTIQLISPAGTGTVDIRVENPDGESAVTTADEVNYVTGPAIQSISPRSGSTLGGTRVTVIGSDFTGVNTVTFGGTAGTDVVVDTPESITVDSPANSTTGPVDVQVSGTGGMSPLDRPADQFTYSLRVAKVLGLSPSCGPATTTVTIAGSGFTKKISAVDFGGVSASFSYVNSKSLTATAPSGTGTVDVTVTNPSGTSSINQPGDQFSYVCASS